MLLSVRDRIEGLNAVGASITFDTSGKGENSVSENTVRCAAHRVGADLGRKISVNRVKGGVSVTFKGAAEKSETSKSLEQKKVRLNVSRQRYAKKGISLPDFSSMAPEKSVKIDLSGCADQYEDRDRTFRMIVSRDAKKHKIKVSCHKTGPDEFTLIRWK